MEFKRRLMRLAIDSVVRRNIPNLKTDRNRSIRSLVDLGIHFASSEQQKKVFTRLEKIAHSKKNPYNGLLLRTVNTCDAEIVRRVGVNLGYTAFTCGTGLIQHYSKKWNTILPWILKFDCPDSTPEQLADLLFESETYGIYNAIFPVNNKNDLDILAKLAKQYPESVFWAVAPTDIIDEPLCETVKSRKNIVLVLETNTVEETSKLQILKKHRLLFGLLCRRTEPFQNCNFLTAAADAGCLFGLYNGTDVFKTAPLHKHRFFFPHNNPKEPLAIINWPRDVRLIGEQIVPGSGCFTILEADAQHAHFELGPILWSK